MTLGPQPIFSPQILKRLIGNENDKPCSEELVLLFLGCEANPPYGSYEHTANLFLDLICRALSECSDSTKTSVNVIIKVYTSSKGDFPSSRDFEECNGVLLPGSFNAAYDVEPWIVELKKLIQKELVAKRRPTLGICFGHQVYADSFEDGCASKCPAGPQAGRKVCNMTKAGCKLLGDKKELELFYTHGDMVEKLPPQGVNLGWNDKVPVQAAVYYATPEAAEEMTETPIAVTFQAHPEYASSVELGLEKTLCAIIDTMEDRGDITPEEHLSIKEDAREQFKKVEQHSINTMIAVGRLLGWFPKV